MADAAGNYVDESLIDNWADGATTAQKQAVIDRMEEQIEKITHDLFYAANFDIKLDGTGKNRLFLGLKPDIISVTSIKVLEVTLDSSWWSYDKNSVFLNLESASGYLAEKHWLLKQTDETVLFPRGYDNVHVVGTAGHSSCPKAIEQAAIIMCRDDNDPTLYTHYYRGQERLGDFSYSSDEKPLTGIREADLLLRLHIKRKALLRAL